MTPEKNILLTNIQRFSLHDGPGIRTTVFLKGCSIYCPWCSNPENLLHREQRYIKKDKSGKVEEEGTYGKWYSPDELYAEVIKDKAFYGACESPSSDGVTVLDFLPGGVTFSGGECMLQMKPLKPLLERLNAEHIHTAVETSLFTSPAQLAIAISHIDLFYVDIKILDPELCSSVLGGKIDLYRKNLMTLLASGKPVVFRLPVIGGYTDGTANRRAVIALIKEQVQRCPNILKVEILKEHNLGTNKYQSLIDAYDAYADRSTQLYDDACAGSTQLYGSEIKMPEYKGVSDELMERYKKEIEEGVGRAIPVEICKI
ncbi:radical SAM protein [Ruminococcus sp. AF21-3]|nr:radical SAM protein [Ruminococcus sp. AF21-3]